MNNQISDKQDIYFANQSWLKIQDLLQSNKKVVLLLPLGTTEPHGPHAPLATDLLISLGMCERAVLKLKSDPELEVLILPPVGYSVTNYASRFPGAITISNETIENLIVDICKSLIKQGFNNIFLVNNHFEPEHIQSIYKSIKLIKTETGVDLVI